MRNLENDVGKIIKQLDSNEIEKHAYIKKNVSQESLSLIQALLLLLN